MALLPSLHAVSSTGAEWSFRAHPDVAQVRLTWRDPSSVSRPVEVHGTPAHGAMAGWVPTEATLLEICADDRFAHTGLGPLSTRWCYSIVPVGGDRARDGAALSAATRTSVTLTGTPVAQVGTFDGSNRELALAPSGFVHYRSTFPRDIDFRAGVDRPDTSWAYLHPGPDDAWAGRRAHRFRLRFDLDQVPADDLDLAIWLVDRHLLRAGSASVFLNGRQCDLLAFGEQRDRVPGADVTVPGKGAGPAYVERPLPRELLTQGENVLDIVKDHGSWIAYDAVGVFARNRGSDVGALA